MRLLESRTYNPGLSRHKIRIMRPVKTKDDFNQDVVTGAQVAEVRAQITALQGRELDAAQQRWANARYRLRFQFIPGIEREYWVEWPLESGMLQLDILDVQDPAGISNYTQLYCGDTHAR